jgi:hypothetical protein
MYAKTITNFRQIVSGIDVRQHLCYALPFQKFALLLLMTIAGLSVAFGQVSVTATAGTMGPTSYSTVNAAFTAINAGTHQGVITVSITGNTTEPATPVPLLKSTAPSSYSSITIMPSGGNWTINSAAAPTASRGIIELNGADNVTIDGDDPGTSGTQNLTIQSAVVATTGIACVRFSSNSATGTDGADNNTLKNCILIGSRNSATSTTANYGFIMSNSTAITTGAYSSLNTRVENNNISRCYQAINLSGTSATYPNTGTQVLNNVIGNATDANAVAQRGITISYSAASSGGAIISGNDIRVGVSATGFTSTIAGIEVGTSNYGITISKNNIHDINQPNTGGYGAHGIYITGSTNNTLSYIENNIIRDCKMVVYQTSTTSTFIPCGVFFTAGATGVNFRHNTVSMSSQLGSGSNYSSFSVNASVSGVVFTTFQNNILSNTHASTSAYCFYTTATGNISGGTVDNNDYYAPGAGGNVGYYNAANRTTLSAWQTATGKDANSVSVNPPFISATDLHLDIANPNITAVEQKGATGTGIITDIDGNTRPNSGTTLPDMGADEVAVPTCTAAAGGTITPGTQNRCVGQTATMTAVGAETGMGIGYQWEVSSVGGGAGFADVTGGAGATTNSYTTDALTAGTYYYRLRVTCTPASVTGYSNELTVVVSANPTAGVSPSAPTTCGGSPVTLTASGGTTYSWSPATGLNVTNSDVVVASPSVSTTYTVAVTNAAGCTATTTVTVTVVPGVGATASATPATVCSGGNTQLNVAASQSFTTPPAASYTFNYQTGYTLQNMTGATSIVASGSDVVASAVTNIGFPFNFGGTNYTQFSASSNGAMGLGSSAVTSADANNSTTVPTIIPAWDDMHTCTNGNVQYLVNTSGGTGNRILIVEWNYGNYAERTGTFTKKVQVWLYEGSNQIKIVYGANTGTGLTSATVGIVSASGNFNDVNTSTNTNNTASAQDANTVWPASGTAYVFTPTGGPAFTYAWTEAPSGTTLAATNIANPMANGILTTTTYTVVVTGNGGCTASSSVVVSAGAPLSASPAATPAAICFGGSSTLSAGATGGGTPYSYLWDDAGGSTSASISVSPGVETTYLVTVTDNCGASTVGSVTVVVNSLPTVSVSPSTGLICNPGGSAVELTAGGASSYTWSPTSGLTPTTGAVVSANPAATTTYTVTGTDSNGCSATSSAVVTVSTALTSPMAAAFHNPFCIGSDLNLSSSVTYPGTYTMNSNSGVGFIDISGTGTSVGVLSDDSEHNIVLPSFTFNGNVYTSARLGNNGSIVLGSSTGEVTHANATLPSTAHGAGNVFLAPYWDDLDVQLGATAVTQTVGSLFIIQYTNSTHDAYTTGGITFQVQLDLTSGAIHFVYQDVIFGSASYDAGVSATIGIQYSSSSATQYSTGTASLVNGQSITFTPPSLNYSWTGPDSFSSALQNPTITAATADAAGTYTVVFTSTGCSASATVSVTTSNTAPVISDCPTVVSVDADPGNCTATASWTEPTASDTDNCQPGNYSFSSDYSPGASFNIGSTPVTYTATDGLATAYCTFNVVVTASPEVCDASNIDEDCDGLSDNDDPDATGQVLYYRDADGDTWGLMGDFVSACDAPSGYVFNDADCDDNNSEVNPEAVEICNEIDDNCNESTDEGVQFTFYFDNDNDNYGDPASSTLACTPPSGYVADNTDCNDNDVFTYPGALEVCDGIDQDCDIDIDEGTLNPYIPDLDDDGYGAGAGDIVWACTAPEGYVPNCYNELLPSCDCDDNNPEINPGAQEICNGLDDDCDVDIDDADASVTGQQSYYLDNDGDNYGAGDLIFSCTLPEDFWSSLNGDCDDFDALINPDAQEICNSLDDDCDFDIDDADASIIGQQSYYLDNDSDTYGAGDQIFSCSLPVNPTSYINGDCDDNNPDINPGAQEICNGGIDDDCDLDADDADASVTGQDAYYPDNDGDTYGAGEPVFSCIQPEMTALADGDCDDNSDTINPGATEECNGGVDDDCDGLIDDDDENVGGQNAYMADNDEDGYGAGDLLMACLQPMGYVLDCNFVPTLIPGCDCDDTNPLINPGATEICNETDDDCDDYTDEELQSTFYADTDNDGYGDPEASTLACTLPVGHVLNADDCNDAAASVNPGATEVCNETDDDCDLVIDEGVATTTYYADADGDGKGNPLVSVEACTQPMGYVSNNTDCDDNTAVPCPKPTATATTDITDVSAVLSWTGTNCASRYRLQYRQKTTPASAWIDVYVTATNYELTGLLEGTNYQWRVGTVCTPGGTSVPDGYVVPLQFKTKYRVYPDADNDGYGDAGSGTVLVITFPSVGYSIDHTDCNDAVFTTHPNATELCNGVDDDCDLVIDDGVVSPYFWYEDSDGDGLGNELVSLNVCTQPSGYVSNSNDCDDNSNILFCAPPTNGSISDLSATTVTISWSEVPCALRYTMQYRQQTIPASTWSTKVNVQDAMTTLAGLMPGTTYQFRVRSLCPQPNPTTSDWLNVTFTTPALPMGLSEEIPSLDINAIDVANNEFTIYPNPSDGRFQISLVSELEEQVTVTITDGFGKLVQQMSWDIFEGRNIGQFDLSNLTNGVYQVQVWQRGLIQSRKVVIVK